MQKTVLITGSSRGIGKSIALCFGRAAYNVVLNASKSEAELAQTKAQLEHEHIPCMAFLGDVSDYSVCQNLFQEISAVFGSVDILINNAGISHIGLFSDMTPDMWQRIMAANTFSAMNCSHLAIPSMVQKKQGIIINISSIWGNTGASCEAIYSASKGAVNGFTKALAKELAPSGIRVNAIACGVIQTQMNADLSKEEEIALTEDIPLCRFGTADEIAKAALFLAEESSSYITGQVLTIDGGMIG